MMMTLMLMMMLTIEPVRGQPLMMMMTLMLMMMLTMMLTIEPVRGQPLMMMMTRFPSQRKTWFKIVLHRRFDTSSHDHGDHQNNQIIKCCHSIVISPGGAFYGFAAQSLDIYAVTVCYLGGTSLLSESK